MLHAKFQDHRTYGSGEDFFFIGSPICLNGENCYKGI